MFNHLCWEVKKKMPISLVSNIKFIIQLNLPLAEDLNLRKVSPTKYTYAHFPKMSPYSAM